MSGLILIELQSKLTKWVSSEKTVVLCIPSPQNRKLPASLRLGPVSSCRAALWATPPGPATRQPSSPRVAQTTHERARSVPAGVRHNCEEIGQNHSHRKRHSIPKQYVSSWPRRSRTRSTPRAAPSCFFFFFSCASAATPVSSTLPVLLDPLYNKLWQ